MWKTSYGLVQGSFLKELVKAYLQTKEFYLKFFQNNNFHILLLSTDFQGVSFEIQPKEKVQNPRENYVFERISIRTLDFEGMV